MGFEAAHLAGGEVGDDDDAAADEVFGGVPLGDAGEDLARGRVGPRSTSRRRSLSALGMRSATRIWATRSSILAKSSMVMAGASGAGAGWWWAAVCWVRGVWAGGEGGAAADGEGGGGLGERGGARAAAGSEVGVLTAAGSVGSVSTGVGFSMSVMIWASPLSARGKMGESGPSLVPGFRPPHCEVVEFAVAGGGFDVAEA